MNLDGVYPTTNNNPPPPPEAPNAFECPEIGMRIASCLNQKELFTKMRLISKYALEIAEQTFIDRLNADVINPRIIGITNVTQLSNFFGDKCRDIKILDLKDIPWNVNDIQEIANKFPNLEHLYLHEHAIAMESLLPLSSINPKITLEIVRIFNSFKPKINTLQIRVPYGTKMITTIETAPQGDLKKKIDITLLTRDELIDHINAHEIFPEDLGVTTVAGLIEFFGDECSKVRSLDFRKLSNVVNSDIEEVVKNFTNLTHLCLFGCTQITCIDILKDCKTLKYLDISRCKEVRDISALEHCEKLEYLYLAGCIEITDISALEQRNMKHLNLSGCRNISNIDFFSNFQELTILDLSGCYRIKNIAALEHCIKLTKLRLGSGVFEIPFNFLKLDFLMV